MEQSKEQRRESDPILDEAGTRSIAAIRCPYCHDEFKDGTKALAVCSACLARHHAACWREHDKCASCGGGEELVPRSSSVRPRSGPSPRAFTLLAVVLAAVAIALAVSVNALREVGQDRHQLSTRADALEGEKAGLERANAKLEAEKAEAEKADYRRPYLDASKKADALEEEVMKLRVENKHMLDTYMEAVAGATRGPRVIREDPSKRPPALHPELARVVELVNPSDLEIVLRTSDPAKLRGFAQEWAHAAEVVARDHLRDAPTEGGDAMERPTLPAALALAEARRLYRIAGMTDEVERIDRAFEALERDRSPQRALEALGK